MRIIRFFYICRKTGRTDLRRGIDGLKAIIQLNGMDPLEKRTLYLFCGRRNDRIRGLTYEGCVLSIENPVGQIYLTINKRVYAKDPQNKPLCTLSHNLPGSYEKMIYIDAKKVIETRIAESMGFEKYKQIMEMVRRTDVSLDLDFQRTFNAFYRVRRNAEWRKAYYDLFETVKDSNASFESIIKTMYEATGNIEASFSSKMLATINPDKPIWDRYVVQNLCLNIRGKTKEDQLECAIDLYAQIVRWYDDFLRIENGRACIAEFDRILPGYVWMSDVKKIDFFLWSIR